ncbi:MAG: helix-turn-helix transcriptional regulator [Flavobacteriaceae bacterium]|nr:helix-turn-helix transcriptional regulator [Flavobacteriaceae bacterium]
MKFLQITFVFFFLSLFFRGQAQYLFKGELQENSNYQTAYLSLVEDYRKLWGIYEDQIISSSPVENNAFQFSGNNLDATNHIYRIHIDNCGDGDEKGHFNGQCDVSRSIIFIANAKDTVHFPVTFDNQLLCSIESKQEYTKALSKIDSLKELMVYDYLSYRSEANKKLNNKNWFVRLQEFGASLDEPLAELYSYQFLSDRSGQFYDYYLEDLQSNAYYNELQNRLEVRYPNTSFTKQYELEIAADKFRVNYDNGSYHEEGVYVFKWEYLFFGLILFISFIIFIRWMMKRKKKKTTQSLLHNELTKQEQKVLDLILQNKTNKEIAQEIFVSVSTVKTHTNNLYKKLKVTSREEVKSLYNK